MKSFIQKYRNGILMVIVEIITGVLLLARPVGFSTAILMVLGIVVAIAGVNRLRKYIMSKPADAMMEHHMAIGVLLILMGIFICMQTDKIESAFSAVSSMYGVLLLICSLFKLEACVNMLRLKRDNVIGIAISTAASFVITALVFLNPFGAVTGLWRFIGIALLVDAALDILAMLWKKLFRKQN